MGLKKCCSCKKKVSVLLFHRNRKRKDGLQTTCKDCASKRRKAYYKEWGDRERRQVLSNKIKNRNRNAKFVLDYLRKHPCVDCNERDPIVLDFDHVRGKKVENISSMIAYGFSIEKLNTEIAKCDPRCANCHRKRTARMRKSYRFLKQGLIL